MSKSHLFLKNEFGISRIFDRTRGRDDNEETLEDGKNYSHQRENFHRCRIEFDQALEIAIAQEWKIFQLNILMCFRLIF